MKILHCVEFYTPSVGGAQEVVRQLSEHMVLMGHDVTVATTRIPTRNRKVINGVKIVEFDIGGNEVRGYIGRDVSKYQNYLTRSKFDVIMTYAAQQWTTDLMLEVLDQISAKKVLVPCGYSGLFDPVYSDYFSKLPRLLSKYNFSIYLSKNYRDIDFAKQNNIKNTILIPNGADEREFTIVNNRKISKLKSKLKISPNQKIILSVGNHTGAKGHGESIKAFIKSKINNSTLLIVGDINLGGGCYTSCVRKSRIYNNLYSKILSNNNQIIVTSLDREETTTAFHAADLFLFLSNIECSPLVLFEAAASGTPFIASSAGNSEEIAKWTKCGLIAKSKTDRNGYTKVDINSASMLIKRVLDDPILYEKMSKAGRKAWKKKFTWEKIAKEYEKIYEKN